MPAGIDYMHAELLNAAQRREAQELLSSVARNEEKNWSLRKYGIILKNADLSIIRLFNNEYVYKNVFLIFHTFSKFEMKVYL